ncbi:LRRNT 2 domain-containing protein [Citrus sinensis]|uniref:LRRNT 2 domain-containing protein n=1 Tax=Citrus sinensis TaxID=2711 RepID=A0ACB8N206_CITSI|nr:LRRNT 2 domain-containing protein [Citrus sinensis]
MMIFADYEYCSINYHSMNRSKRHLLKSSFMKITICAQISAFLTYSTLVQAAKRLGGKHFSSSNKALETLQVSSHLGWVKIVVAGAESAAITELPSLLQLKDLEYLDLSMNNFTGFQVPEFIGSLKELRYLNLSGSFFSGTIPQTLGNLSNLLYLDLNNFLDQSNQIDLEWLSGLSSLVYFNLGGADLSKAGAYWLEVFNKLHYLIELHLPNFNLSSLLLSFPSLNFASLQVLDLSNNGFNSTIPHWLFNIASLLSLDLSSNDLRGFIKLRSCQLGPKFSTWLRNQTELRTLVLNKARISDTISDWFWQLSLTLDELDVAYNELRGRVPNSLGFNFPAKVDLSFNNFEGRLLLWSFNVTKLYLRDNSFSGLIPNDIGQNLPFLTDLGISFNF